MYTWFFDDQVKQNECPITSGSGCLIGGDSGYLNSNKDVHKNFKLINIINLCMTYIWM